MFIRVLFAFRAALNYVHTMDLHSNYICKKFGFKPTLTFTFKALVKHSPGKLVIGLNFCVYFSLAYLMRIAEIPYWYASG